MAVSERARRVMTEGLVEALGEEVTDTLLAHLPPVGWGDVATQQDLAALKVEMAALKTELKDAMKALKAEMKAEMKADLHREIALQTRVFVLSMVMVTIAIAGLT